MTKETFDELNKPLSMAHNQEHVARKLNEFKESIEAKFNSSSVPTPAVKDFYKQCAGGEPHSSASEDGRQEVLEDAKEAIPAQVEIASQEKAIDGEIAEKRENQLTDFVAEENQQIEENDRVSEELNHEPNIVHTVEIQKSLEPQATEFSGSDV